MPLPLTHFTEQEYSLRLSKSSSPSKLPLPKIAIFCVRGMSTISINLAARTFFFDFVTESPKIL